MSQREVEPLLAGYTPSQLREIEEEGDFPRAAKIRSTFEVMNTPGGRNLHALLCGAAWKSRGCDGVPITAAEKKVALGTTPDQIRNIKWARKADEIAGELRKMGWYPEEELGPTQTGPSAA